MIVNYWAVLAAAIASMVIVSIIHVTLITAGAIIGVWK